MQKIFKKTQSLAIRSFNIQNYLIMSETLSYFFVFSCTLIMGFINPLSAMQQTSEDERLAKGGLASISCTLDETFTFEKESVDYNLVSTVMGFSSGLRPQRAPQQSVLHYEDPTITSSLEEKVLLRGIKGIDGRFPINHTTHYPYSCFGRLSIQFSERVYAGSAVAVGPNHVITAAHCILNDQDQQWPDKVAFYSGLNGDVAPFGEATVVRIFVPKEYFDNGNKDYDFALLVLDRPLGLQTGYLGCIFANDVSLFKQQVAVTGYPADKGRKNMWSMAHTVKYIGAERIHYDIDTYGGQSGSPIWSEFIMHQQGNEQGLYPLVVGIHTHGESQFGEGNSGIRFTEAKFKLIMKWIALTKVIASSSRKEPLRATPVNKKKAGLPFTQPSIKDPDIDRVIDTDGCTRLHKRALKGDLQGIKDLLSRGAALMMRTNEGNTALHLAAEKGFAQVVDFLLQCGSDNTALNKKNMRPLHLAAWEGHSDVTKALIAHGDDENSVLCWAAAHGRCTAIKLLVECGAQLDFFDRITHHTPLIAALYGNHVKAAKLLIRKGADLSQPSEFDYKPLHYLSFFADLPIIQLLMKRGMDKNLLLHWAVRDGKTDIVEYLLMQGADVNSRFPNTNLTPLFWAVIGNHCGIAQMLFKNGAKIDMPLIQNECKSSPSENYYARAFFANFVSFENEKDAGKAAEKAAKYMTISLRKKSFNAQHREHANGGLASTSPSKKLTLKTRSESFTVDGLTQTSDDGEIRKMLHYSTNEEIVLTLIERVFQQCTLLHCAVLFGHAKMAEWLIDHGANLDARDVDLCTPLHYAALGGFTDIVDLLLKRGADANARNHFGETPLCSLHVAARKSARHIDTPLARGDSIVMKIWINRNMKEVVRLLGVHKADFNIPNRRGATPLHLFASKEKRDDVEVVELLLQFGANANNKDLDGRLPIQYAVCDGMKELLKKNTDSCTIC